MGKYFRTSQEINRVNPDYKYVITIKSSMGWLGGYDVEVQGFAKGNDNKDDNENYLSEWFWKRPSRDKLMELVDRLHMSVRSSMDERDWDAIKDSNIQKELEEMRKKMREEFESELERKLKEKAAELKGKGKQILKP